MNAERDDEEQFTRLSLGMRGELKGWACFPCDSHAKAMVIVVHGLGEHADRYRELASFLATHSLATVVFDQQGHGRWSSRHGRSRGYDSMLADIQQVVHQIEDRWPHPPKVLLGTSMGGNLAANYVLRGSHHWSGLCLVAPMFLPAKPPRREQIMAAWLTGKLLPFLHLSGKTKPNELTHDEDEIRAIEEDPLLHSRVSLKLATELIGHGRWVLDNSRLLTLPMLVLHGEKDRVVELAASSALCTKAGPNAKMIRFPRMYHDILHEVERRVAFEHIHRWIDEICHSQTR